jgi:hypothetical protein
MSCCVSPFRVPLVYLSLQKNQRIAAPGVGQICFQLLLPRAHPRCVVLLRDPHALVAEQDRNSFNGHSSEKQFDSECVAETVRMPVHKVCEFEFDRILTSIDTNTLIVVFIYFM